MSSVYLSEILRESTLLDENLDTLVCSAGVGIPLTQTASKCTRLRSLSLSQSQDMPFSPSLVHLHTLERFFACDLNLGEVPFLPSHVVAVSLQRCKLTRGTSRLQNLTSLTDLNLDENKLSSLRIGTLILLTSLSVVDNKLSHVHDLQSLKQLREVHLDGNHLESLEPLADLPNLTELSASDNRLHDLRFVSRMTQLTRLDLQGNQIAGSAAELGSCVLLEEVYLSNNLLVSLGSSWSWNGLTRLKSLDIEANQISSLNCLAGLTQLQSLRCSWNPIRDVVAVVSKLPMLQRLSVAYMTPPVSLKDVFKMTRIRSPLLLCEQNRAIMNLLRTTLYLCVMHSDHFSILLKRDRRFIAKKLCGML